MENILEYILLVWFVISNFFFPFYIKNKVENGSIIVITWADMILLRIMEAFCFEFHAYPIDCDDGDEYSHKIMLTNISQTIIIYYYVKK